MVRALTLCLSLFLVASGVTVRADAAGSHQAGAGPGVVHHQNLGAFGGLAISFNVTLSCGGNAAGTTNEQCSGTVWVECAVEKCSQLDGFSFHVCNDRDDNDVCTDSDSADNDVGHDHGPSPGFDDQWVTGYSSDGKDQKAGDHSGEVSFCFAHDANDWGGTGPSDAGTGSDGIEHNFDSILVFIGSDLDDPVNGDELKAGLDFGEFDVFLDVTAASTGDCGTGGPGTGAGAVLTGLSAPECSTPREDDGGTDGGMFDPLDIVQKIAGGKSENDPQCRWWQGGILDDDESS